MYWVWYGKLKQLEDIEYMKWFQKNRSRFEENLTDGIRLIDFYLVINSTADHDFEFWYEIDNWAVLDNWRKQAEDPNSKYAKFIQAMINETGVLIEQVRSKFLRPAGQVAIFQPSKS